MYFVELNYEIKILYDVGYVFLVGWGECFEKLEVYLGLLAYSCFSPSGFSLPQSTPTGTGVDCILF